MSRNTFQCLPIPVLLFLVTILTVFSFVVSPSVTMAASSRVLTVHATQEHTIPLSQARVLHANTATHVCNKYVLPVTLSPAALTTYHVVGWLCYNGQPSQTVELLVSGATYSHVYWDFPYQPETYSFVQAMNKVGYTTLNIDRIGIGESDHPLPELLTMQSNAYVLHQLVSDLKAGSIGGQAFQKVLLVGHSIGSAMSIVEASTYADVDGLVLSGFIHFFDPLAPISASNDLYPAILDPKFSNSGYLPGYLTTKPQTRGQSFYYLSNADSSVVAEDEAAKETVTETELSTFISVIPSPISVQIHVPVLNVIGQYDNLFCLGTFSCTNNESVQTHEAVYYSPQAHLQVLVLPQAGHVLNLQRNASVWYSAAISWVQSNFR